MLKTRRLPSVQFIPVGHPVAILRTEAVEVRHNAKISRELMAALVAEQLA